MRSLNFDDDKSVSYVPKIWIFNFFSFNVIMSHHKLFCKISLVSTSLILRNTYWKFSYPFRMSYVVPIQSQFNYLQNFNSIFQRNNSAVLIYSWKSHCLNIFSVFHKFWVFEVLFYHFPCWMLSTLFRL